ncbi:MAG: tetratricopeptide repeat protein, partial [Acidimicrobiales bacterium]
LGVAGRPDTAVRPLCEEALRALGPEPSALRSKVTARLAMHRCLWANEGVAAGPIAQDALDIARRVGDLDALHLGLLVRAITLVGTPQVGDRLAVAEELVGSAERSEDVPMQASGLRLRALARLELGDVEGFDADLERVVLLSTALRRRQYLSEAARWRGLRALFDGRFSELEQHTAEMLAQAGDDVNASTARAAQFFFLWRDQGRIEEARRLPEAAVKKTPGLVALQALVALADAELGDTAKARRAFDSFAEGGFAGVPHDFTWTASLSILTDLCDVLGDTSRAPLLLELFRPHAGHLVVMGWGDVCPGAVDRYLGILATTSRRLGEAEAAFESALAIEARVGSAPSLVRTETRFGRMLITRAGPGDVGRARELLGGAQAKAERMGMVKVAAEARSLVAAL